MKKNNKGFTMIEIIGIIVIMGVLLLLIIPGVSKLMEQFRKDYYKKLEDSINESGKDFFNDNKLVLPNGILESFYVNVDLLIDQKYADSLLDYKGNTCELADRKSYTIVVYRGDGKYEYQTCIDCSGDEYVTDKSKKYCDPAWLDNVLHYDYGGTDDIYFYYGTPREEIREELIKTLNIVKKDSNGNVLDRVVIGDTNEEGILPTNIDVIDNKPTLDSNNEKKYEMIYENAKECESGVSCDDIKLNAVIYKHKAPKVTMTSKGYVYNSGNWTNQNVIILLEKNDNFFDADGVSVSKYQWQKSGETIWRDITCEMTGDDGSCSVSVDTDDDYLEETYKFRLVNSEENISDETGNYTIKIDKGVPILSLDYSFDETYDGSLYIDNIEYSAMDNAGIENSGLSKIEYVKKNNSIIPNVNETGTILSISGSSTTDDIDIDYVSYDFYYFFRVIDKAGNKSDWKRSNNIFIGNKISIPSYNKIDVGTIGETYDLTVYKCNDSTCNSASIIETNGNKFNLNNNNFYKFYITNGVGIEVSRVAYLGNLESTTSNTITKNINVHSGLQLMGRYIKDEDYCKSVDAYLYSYNQIKITTNGTYYDYNSGTSCPNPYTYDQQNGKCVYCNSGTYNPTNMTCSVGSCSNGQYNSEGKCVKCASGTEYYEAGEYVFASYSNQKDVCIDTGGASIKYASFGDKILSYDGEKKYICAYKEGYDEIWTGGNGSNEVNCESGAKKVVFCDNNINGKYGNNEKIWDDNLEGCGGNCGVKDPFVGIEVSEGESGGDLNDNATCKDQEGDEISVYCYGWCEYTPQYLTATITNALTENPESYTNYYYHYTVGLFVK